MTSTAPHQALYRRWRAQTFAQIVGQEAVVETLRNAVRTDRVAHAILFVGPRGTGKTSLARILAKALNCTDLRDGDPCDACPSCIAIREGTTLDVLEIDAASNRGINEIKDLRERLQYAPSQLRRKVYILDEAHQITRDAWNALLKSLEEPPEYVVFMFASTHPQEFPPAILSRLQRYDVRRLTVDEIEGKLLRILEADERAADGAAVRLIARLAAGGMRDAESMLDQLLASSGDRLDEAFVRELLGLADAEAVEQFVAALVAGDAAVGIRILDALEERGRDARVFLDQVVEVIRARIVELVSEAGGGEAVPAVASVARRLAAIDPNRAGVGGLRLQLELALFASPSTVPGLPATERPARTPELVPHSRTAREQVAPKAVAKPRATVADPATVRTSTGSPAPAAGTAVPTGGAPAVAASAPAAPPASGGRADVDATAEARAASSDRPARTGAPAEPGGTGDEPATTPTPLTAVAPQPTPAGGATDLDVLRRRWPEVVAHISQHPPTKPLIAACRPISVDGNVVVLGFPEDQAFLKDVAERRRPILESGVGEFLGRPVAVRCVATNLDLVPPPAADEDAAFVLSEARRIFADDLVDVGEVS